MRAVVQRVSEASVAVDGEVIGRIEKGLLVLLGVGTDDMEEDAKAMTEKLVGLRLFNDADNKMNLSVIDVGGRVLMISQFTLHGDCRKGRRPSFVHAARPEQAVPLYDSVIRQLRDRNLTVETGSFGATMEVSLVNSGPVTLLVDTKKVF